MDETFDAMWATTDEIMELINKNEFIPLNDMKYVYELLEGENNGFDHKN